MKHIPILTIVVLLTLACRFFGLGGTTIVSSDLDPYKGQVATLLPKEAGDSVIKFKLDSSQPTSFPGAKEAVKADYTMQAGSIGVKAQLTIVNFASRQEAEAAMQAFATSHNLTLENKTKNGKTVGKRLVYNDGKAIMWSNGSLQCLSFSDFAKTSSNLEDALQF